MTPVAVCRVRDAMTYRPVTIAPDATLADAGRLFETLGVGSLPVTIDGSLVGILTRLDVLKAFAPGEGAQTTFEQVMATPVAAVMTRDPVTVDPASSLAAALETMVGRRCAHVPVVFGALLVGILARGDVVRALRAAAGGAGARGRGDQPASAARSSS
jgi:CBS domain-containing protein